MIKEKILFWANAIFYIILWWIMMFQPNLALDTIIIAFWIESILSGIVWIVFAVQDKESWERWTLSVIAISQILIWVLLTVFPIAWETILKVFIILLGIWGIIKWILLVINSFKLKKIGLENRGRILAAWIFLIFLWLFLSSNSLLTIFIINSVIGLWMVIAGITMIILALQTKKKVWIIKKQIEEAIENNEWIEIEITKVRKF